MNMQTAIAPAPRVSLTIEDAYGYARFDADDLDGVFAAIEHRNQQLAAYAASRNAISTATASPIPTADSTSGSEARPARKRKAGGETGGGMETGKGENGDAEAADEAQAPLAASDAASAEETAGSASDTASPEDDTDAPQAASYDDVKNAVVALAAAKGRDAAVAVLDQFGVDHASKLTEEQWPEAVQALIDAKDAE